MPVSDCGVKRKRGVARAAETDNLTMNIATFLKKKNAVIWRKVLIHNMLTVF